VIVHQLTEDQRGDDAGRQGEDDLPGRQRHPRPAYNVTSPASEQR
jgi:hypothetical protein